ncbi:MAG TPA: hypothetical protein PLO54_07675 [Bacilli bacterium]|jgi:hypothetical protein|nr:hypothetical protein [Bacilli bacterium]
MKIKCVWEHNGNDSLLHAVDFVGAYTRGPSKEATIEKMPAEIASYARWIGVRVYGPFEVEVAQEVESKLDIRDADTEAIFEVEKEVLLLDEYERLKQIALKSAQDFLFLYEAIPDKHKSCLCPRRTFYGNVPRAAHEMHEHAKNVNAYYFGEIGVAAGNQGDIFECRKLGFELLEKRPGFLDAKVYRGSYGEEWSVRKVLRRFIWHDRIHAKAMFRMAKKTFGDRQVPNIFLFE